MENIAASKAAFIRPVTKINAFSREFSFDESDCSNPQQGTGRGLNSPCMAQSPLTLAVGLVRNGMPSPPTSSECDYSAVMQKGAEEVAGRTQEVRLALKIPPTSKDNRKLFVGGLPMDGTY